ncbi:MAG: plastocyanin/azurin family copper-binding protein [Pirellulaceae bacterium]
MYTVASSLDLPVEFRTEAIENLAQHRQQTQTQALLTVIQSVDQQFADTAEEAEKHERTAVLNDLAELMLSRNNNELHALAAEWKSLVESARAPVTQQLAFACLMNSEDTAGSAKELSAGDDDRFANLLRSLKNVTSENARQQWFEPVQSLLTATDKPSLTLAAIDAVPSVQGDIASLLLPLANLMNDQRYRDAAVAAGMRVPPELVTPEAAERACETLRQHLQTLEIAQRTTAAGQNGFALVKVWSLRLPDAQRMELQQQLELLRVRVFQVKTLEEKMLYDRTVLVVRPGQAVQIDFENDDIMPHNLVVLSQPEDRITVGLQSDELQNEPEHIQRGYLPVSEAIMAATKMLQPQQRDSVTFVAPSEPTTIPFICTFPGHWIKMYGAIAVVPDEAAFLAANKNASADDLLGIKTVDWNFDQLAANLNQFDQGRSFATGARLFKQASCASCHRMQGEGGVIGPELTDIRTKHKTARDLLWHIMKPSDAVEEKYASVIIYDTSGKTIRGTVVDRTETQIMLKQNPLETCEPIIVAIADIEEEVKSNISPMPEQLLNTITSESDVYDLLAFILASGKADSPLYP